MLEQFYLNTICCCSAGWRLNVFVDIPLHPKTLLSGWWSDLSCYLLALATIMLKSKGKAKHLWLSKDLLLFVSLAFSSVYVFYPGLSGTIIYNLPYIFSGEALVFHSVRFNSSFLHYLLVLAAAVSVNVTRLPSGCPRLSIDCPKSCQRDFAKCRSAQSLLLW